MPTTPTLDPQAVQYRLPDDAAGAEEAYEPPLVGGNLMGGTDPAQAAASSPGLQALAAMFAMNSPQQSSAPPEAGLYDLADPDTSAPSLSPQMQALRTFLSSGGNQSSAPAAQPAAAPAAPPVAPAGGGLPSSTVPVQPSTAAATAPDNNSSNPIQQLQAMLSAAAPTPSTPAAPVMPTNSPVMPTMHQPNNTVLKVLGALSALGGGQGGIAAARAVDQQEQQAQQQYAQQMATYDAQMEQQRYAQQEQDQQQARAGDAAQANEQLYAHLGGMDADAQQRLVSTIAGSPQLAAAYGTTPAALQAAFFKNGQFQPVGQQEKASDLSRSQLQARGQLAGMTPQAQQSLHDTYSSAPDQWQSLTGLPFAGFTPLETEKDAQGDEKVAQGNVKLAQGATKLQQSQATLDATNDLKAAQVALTKAKIGGVLSDVKAKTQQVQIAQGRLNESIRQDNARNALTTRGQDMTATDAANRDAITERGQDLAHDDRDAGLAVRVQAMQDAAARSGNTQLMGLARESDTLAREKNTNLGTISKITAGLAAKDDNGNPLIADPQVRAMYQDQLSSLQQRNNLIAGRINLDEAKIQGVGSARPAASASPGLAALRGVLGLAPAPVVPTARGWVTNGLGQRIRAAVPSAPPLPGSGSSTRAGGGLDTWRRMQGVAVPSARAGGSSRPVTPGAPEVLTGKLTSGQGFEFHVPNSRQDFEALTPGKRQIYVQWLRQQGKVK